MLNNLYWKKLVPLSLIWIGIGSASLAIIADLIGIGSPGFGPNQILMALVGASLLLSGIMWRHKASLRRVVGGFGPPVSTVQLLVLAAWFGLLGGVGESLLLGVRKWGLHTIFKVNPHYFWMKPLANLIFFGGIVLILLALTWCWPKIISIRPIASIFIFLGCFALFNFPMLHPVAKMLLAAGLAVQLSRLIVNRYAGFKLMVRRTTPLVVILTVSLGLGVYLWKVLPEHRIISELPPAKPDAPNVLLLVLDTVRAQSLSVYGYNRSTTPVLEQFSKEGICFEQAFSTSPWTLPSHGTMFTGRFPHELFTASDTPLNPRTPIRVSYPTLAEVLSEHGYLTAGFVANLSYCTYAHGLHRGFAHYEDYRVSVPELFRSSRLTFWLAIKIWGNPEVADRKKAAEVNRAFLNWLDRQNGRSFFAFLNYFDAHDPYIPPKPFDREFGVDKPKDPFVRFTHKYKAHEIQALQDAYDGCIASLDHEIGLLLDDLRERGVLENTLVIITSDHGEQFGEHGLMYHVNSLYRPLLHVPLFISFPKRVPAGKRVKETVSLRDLPATVMDLLELKGEDWFPGNSLARCWKDVDHDLKHKEEMQFAEIVVGQKKPEWCPESWPVSRGRMTALLGLGYHYIQNGDGSEELYDIDEDPKEERNLANSEDGYALLPTFRSTLKSILAIDQSSSWQHAPQDTVASGGAAQL